MNAKQLLGGIEGNVGDVINNIDLVMASNTQITQENNNNNYELCVDSNNISKKGEFEKPNIDIENYVEIGGTTVMNATNGKGGTQKKLQN
jgi:hypothetical protein